MATVVCNNGLSISKLNLGVNSVKIKSLRRNTGVCCCSPFATYNLVNSQSFLLSRNKFRSLFNGESEGPLLGLCLCSKSQFGLSCHNNNGNKETYLRKRLHNGVRKKFSLRLRPRLRLFTSRLKRVSVKSLLKDVGMFIREHEKSEFITSLENGSVSNVRLEEGSRRIYYNTNPQANGSTQDSKESQDSEKIDVTNENAADAVVRGDILNTTGQVSKMDKLKRFSEHRAYTPEWQFSTRKIDHDEKFLLSVMREKGTVYSSAPQSALMSMRSTLITIISLWIPLTPLMWLLYRQLSAANSPTKKR